MTWLEKMLYHHVIIYIYIYYWIAEKVSTT